MTRDRFTFQINLTNVGAIVQPWVGKRWGKSQLRVWAVSMTGCFKCPETLVKVNKKVYNLVKDSRNNKKGDTNEND